jgi:hypothetical protein
MGFLVRFWFGLVAFACVRVQGFSLPFSSVQFVANELIESFLKKVLTYQKKLVSL